MKTKPTHTPGPWVVEDGRILGNNGGMGVLLAIQQTPVMGSLNREYEANGLLLAAAPELLAALRGLVCELDSVKVRAPGLIHARAAIAKAEGR